MSYQDQMHNQIMPPKENRDVDTKSIIALADALDNCVTKSGGIDLRDPELLFSAARALRIAVAALVDIASIDRENPMYVLADHGNRSANAAEKAISLARPALEQEATMIKRGIKDITLAQLERNLARYKRALNNKKLLPQGVMFMFYARRCEMIETEINQRAQRKSWVIGEMLLANPEMSREAAERIYDRAERS